MHTIHSFAELQAGPNIEAQNLSHRTVIATNLIGLFAPLAQIAGSPPNTGGPRPDTVDFTGNAISWVFNNIAWGLFGLALITAVWIATRAVNHSPGKQQPATNRESSPVDPIQYGSNLSMNGRSKNLRLFLCHAKEDKTVVRDLYRRLMQDGYQPWFDEEDILPGQDWEYEISNAAKHSDIFLVCLSRHSVAKTGFVQREVRYALDLADERPEGRIFLIPCRLEDCQLPTRLKGWQCVDLFGVEGYSRLIRSLAYVGVNN